MVCTLSESSVVARVQQKLDDLLRPIRAVSQETEVAQRFLRATELALDLAELVGEFDKELSVAMALVLGKCENAGNVVVVRRLFLFREVTNDMATGGIPWALQVL